MIDHCMYSKMPGLFKPVSVDWGGERERERGGMSRQLKWNSVSFIIFIWMKVAGIRKAGENLIVSHITV
jgi:hypothetical protein